MHHLSVIHAESFKVTIKYYIITIIFTILQRENLAIINEFRVIYYEYIILYYLNHIYFTCRIYQNLNN